MLGLWSRHPGSTETAKTRQSLLETTAARPVIVLGNRAPWRHEAVGDRAVPTRSASGLVTALEPLVAATAGTWVAHGADEADRTAVVERDGLEVPPASPQYRLRYVWLTREEQRGYYEGFANEALW